MIKAKRMAEQRGACDGFLLVKAWDRVVGCLGMGVAPQSSIFDYLNHTGYISYQHYLCLFSFAEGLSPYEVRIYLEHEAL